MYGGFRDVFSRLEIAALKVRQWTTHSLRSRSGVLLFPQPTIAKVPDSVYRCSFTGVGYRGTVTTAWMSAIGALAGISYDAPSEFFGRYFMWDKNLKF